MFLPDNIRDCVAFVGYERRANDFVVLGTAFFLYREIGVNEKAIVYAVTARHVIDAIKLRSCHEVCLRVNRIEGGADWIKTDLLGWFSHPDDDLVDVAVLRCN